MTMQTVSLIALWRHARASTGTHSRETKTDMTFSVYVPPHPDGAKLPWSGISPD